jgi:arsenate reductase (thioredoxin)
MMPNTKPAVLFLCTHNAGRSQMAMGFFQHLAGNHASVYSGGSEPAAEVNPAAIEAMAEKGIDIATEQPKRWTMDMLEAVDVVITMGCGDACPILPGRRYEEWALPDPAGQPLDAIRPIRDEIEQRVHTLLSQLGVRFVGGIDHADEDEPPPDPTTCAADKCRY